MDIKQYKASLQLAQMRHNAENSESSQALLEKAQQAYDSAKNSEIEKKDQVSGETKNPASQADNTTPTPTRKSPASVKAAVKAITDAKPVVKAVVEPEADSFPENTAEAGDKTGDTDKSGEPEAQFTAEEKKTEE